MTSGSEQHYYLARRGNGTDTYSKSLKSPKVEKLFSNKDKPRETRVKKRTTRTHTQSKVRKNKDRDSFRYIPIGYSKAMKDFWDKLLQNGGEIGDSVLRFMPSRNFLAEERFKDSDASTGQFISSSIDQDESSHSAGDSL